MNKLVLLFLGITISLNSYSQTWLPSFFSDNMMLQRNTEVSIWGKDLPGTEITISGSWGMKEQTTADKDGKWQLSIATTNPGGPYSLSVEGSKTIYIDNILMGEVWLCSGQSNMEMPVKGLTNQPINESNETILHSRNQEIRYFEVEKNNSLVPLNDVVGRWKIAEPSTVKDFSAVAYFFGKKLYDLTNMPVGLIETSWGGSSAEAWTDKETLQNFPEIIIPDKIEKDMALQRTPTLLYNAMIHPLVKYTIKGAIWYQGESNRLAPEQYKKLFPAMINAWRQDWEQGNFPFYFVQIAPFGYGNGNAGFIREAQLFSYQNVENTGIVITLDIGDCDYIHPRKKREVGERLAYWALAKDYGFDGFVYSGPLYKEMEITEDGKINISFDYAPNGLSSFGKELTGFEIAGNDKVFHPARVIINRNRTITVWSEKVPEPVSVRYAFSNCPEATLFNIEGLPASSFRTDNWEE